MTPFDFFLAQLQRIQQALAAQPTHASGPKRPTMTEQEDRGSK